MSKIRSKNTKAERAVFKELRRNKIYFQKHYRKIKGCPDIAIPSKKLAVFIDGDFWHGRDFSNQKKRLPKKYWLQKIKANIERDALNRRLLRGKGWKIMRVWETDILRNKPKILNKIIAFIA